MRYLLVLGFACDVYRREPRARIFVGDKLIDEFYIQHHINTDTTKISNLCSSRQTLEPFPFFIFHNFIKNLAPLRFYSLEIDKILNHIDLRIEIENTDSNNTNGFITKSTLIQMKACFFIPLHEKLLLRLRKIQNKNLITPNYVWYRVKKNEIFNLVRNGMWWQGKNSQMLSSDNWNLAEYKIGGNGIFTCELVKKYQILISKTKKSYRHHFNLFYVDYLLNKYNEYANQRNFN